MHLGYHELRNMLGKFREERDKRKMGTATSTGPSSGAAGGAGKGGGDHRSSRDDRERERGYDRHASRYE